MPLPLIILCIAIVIALIYLRIKVVYIAFSDWEYYVYKYKKYCALNYLEEKKASEIRKNEANVSEAVMLFLMVWKINPDYFFDYKPDFEEIYDLYILNK